MGNTQSKEDEFPKLDLLTMFKEDRVTPLDIFALLKRIEHLERRLDEHIKRDITQGG